MNLTRKTGRLSVEESGTIPGLPEQLSKDSENTNWWFEVRSVLGRQQEALSAAVLPDNVSFSTSTSSPYEYVYTHGLGKYPMVQVLDSSEQVIQPTITHNSIHDFTVSHTSALTGTLIIH